MEGHRPTHERRFAALKATIRAIDTEHGTLLSVTPSRMHKSGEVWQRSEPRPSARYVPATRRRSGGRQETGEFSAALRLP